jgi:hypothetical protein
MHVDRNAAPIEVEKIGPEMKTKVLVLCPATPSDANSLRRGCDHFHNESVRCRRGRPRSPADDLREFYSWSVTAQGQELDRVNQTKQEIMRMVRAAIGHHHEIDERQQPLQRQIREWLVVQRVRR